MKCDKCGCDIDFKCYGKCKECDIVCECGYIMAGYCFSDMKWFKKNA
jgi:hypothetical protein